MFSRQTFEDSYTLDNYIYFIQSLKTPSTEQQPQIQPSEIEKIEYFAQRKRKMSTQMSLFSWLVKDKPPQNSLLLSLDKELILKIFSYLRISQVFIVSSVSSYMYSCYKHLWIDKNFFEQFETDKFTSEELNKVIEKSKLDHIKQLKQIYLGKNIKKNREKQFFLQIRIKMRVTDESSGKNCMLQVFSISPKVKNGTVFIMDSHLENILNSSYKGLQCIELHRCPYIKNFAAISKCIELQKFSISYNEYVTTESLSQIFKRCLKLSKLEISQCKNLDENIFKQLQKVEELQSLSLRFFKQSFGKLPLLSECLHLTELNIDDSLITDDELMAGVRELKNVQKLSIQGCALLTNIIAQFLLQRLYRVDIKLRDIAISRINGIECQKIEQIEQKIYRLKLEKGPGQR